MGRDESRMGGKRVCVMPPNLRPVTSTRRRESAYRAKCAAEFEALRRSSNLSQVELAVALDVSPRTIRSWEAGDTAVPAEVLDEMRDRAKSAA